MPRHKSRIDPEFVNLSQLLVYADELLANIKLVRVKKRRHELNIAIVIWNAINPRTDP